MIARSHLKLAAIYLLKLLGTGVFLYWAFSQIEDTQALRDNFKMALKSPLWVGAGLGFGAITVLAGALRWYVLLRAQSIEVSFIYVVRATLIAALFNIVSIGGTVGNAARMITVMRRNPGKKVIITATVMLDHMIGFVANGLVFLVFLWGAGVLSQTESVAFKNTLMAVALFEACGIAFISLFVIISSPKMMDRLRKRFPRFSRRDHFKSFTSSMQTARATWRSILVSLCAAIVLSLSYFMAFFAALQMIHEKIEISTLLTVMPIVDAVSAMPISVSGLGVREKTFEYLLSEMTNISSASAVSASLMGFLFQVFWGLVGGVLLIVNRSHKPSEIEPSTS